MRKILAIAGHSVQSALRSKLFAVAAIVLVTFMAALAFFVKGDGTAVGEARVLIHYTLAAASMLIGMLSLVQACGAVSQEISERQIQLIRCKPVSAMHIWLGKWLGILAVNCVLILLAGIATRSAMALRGMGGDEVAREILTARRRIVPDVPGVEQEVTRRFHVLKDAGRISEDAGEKSVKAELKLGVIAERTTVGPGQERSWPFLMPSGSRPDDEGLVELRSRFNAVFRDEEPIRCSWRVVSVEGRELFSVPEAGYYEGLNSIVLPSGLIRDNDSLMVVVRNEETASGRTLVFNQKQGVEILVSEGGFNVNMIKAMLIMFMLTALLAALGVTLGSVFSFPVAVFVSVSLLAASLTAHFFATTDIAPHSHDGDGDCKHEQMDVSWGDKLSVGFERLSAPVLDAKPAEMLSQGILITWTEVGGLALIMLILYPGIMFLGAAYGLSRRQLALPEMLT